MTLLTAIILLVAAVLGGLAYYLAALWGRLPAAAVFGVGVFVALLVAVWLGAALL